MNHGLIKNITKLLDLRKQVELQLGQDPRQNSDDTHNLNSVRHETHIFSRNKEGISEK
jgi:hypothetical protein